MTHRQHILPYQIRVIQHLQVSLLRQYRNFLLSLLVLNLLPLLPPWELRFLLLKWDSEIFQILQKLDKLVFHLVVHFIWVFFHRSLLRSTRFLHHTGTFYNSILCWWYFELINDRVLTPFTLLYIRPKQASSSLWIDYRKTKWRKRVYLW